MDGSVPLARAVQIRGSPSVSLALPPVGWQSTLVHAPQRTTVCACEKTVVMAKQPEVARELRKYV